MKTLIALTAVLTLSSCAQIEKATEKWKTPEGQATATASSTSASTQKETKEVDLKLQKKKKKATKQAKATTK